MQTEVMRFFQVQLFAHPLNYFLSSASEITNFQLLQSVALILSFLPQLITLKLIFKQYLKLKESKGAWLFLEDFFITNPNLL